MRCDSGVNSVDWSPDGTTLAAGCFGKIYFVDPTTGEIKSSKKVDAGRFGVQSVAFSPKGDMVAAGCNNGNLFFVDAAAGQIKSSLRGGKAIFSLAFSPDGQLIATGEGDPYDPSEAGAVRIYCASTGQVKRALTGHQSGVSSVHFSPDGTRLVTGSYDKTVKIWNPATGEELCQLRVFTY